MTELIDNSELARLARRAARRKARESTPEARAKRRARQKKYDADPIVKAKRKARDATPGGRARRAQYNPAARERYYKPVVLEARLKAIVDAQRTRLNKLARSGRILEHTITHNDLLELWHKQDGKCALSGAELTARVGHTNTVSVDRIDSTIGYVKDNVQLVTVQVNVAKNKWTDAEFVAMCQAVYEHNRPT